LIRGAAVDDHQRCAFGRGVVVQPREQIAGQRAGFERAAMGVPVWHGPEHRPLVCRHGRQASRPHPGEQTPLAGLGEQVGLGVVAEGADREAQPEQRRTAADDHFPAARVFQQLAARVGVQLDRLFGDGEPPRLGVVHRRCAGSHLDQVASPFG
jgi:hypothetical protein